jgi:hypothetical protein
MGKQLSFWAFHLLYLQIFIFLFSTICKLVSLHYNLVLNRPWEAKNWTPFVVLPVDGLEAMQPTKISSKMPT